MMKMIIIDRPETGSPPYALSSIFWPLPPKDWVIFALSIGRVLLLTKVASYIQMRPLL